MATSFPGGPSSCSALMGTLQAACMCLTKVHKQSKSASPALQHPGLAHLNPPLHACAMHMHVRRAWGLHPAAPPPPGCASCPTALEPVCGTDSIQYANACIATCQGVELAVRVWMSWGRRLVGASMRNGVIAANDGPRSPSLSHPYPCPICYWLSGSWDPLRPELSHGWARGGQQPRAESLAKTQAAWSTECWPHASPHASRAPGHWGGASVGPRELGRHFSTCQGGLPLCRLGKACLRDGQCPGTRGQYRPCSASRPAVQTAGPAGGAWPAHRRAVGERNEAVSEAVGTAGGPPVHQGLGPPAHGGALGWGGRVGHLKTPLQMLRCCWCGGAVMWAAPSIVEQPGQMWSSQGRALYRLRDLLPTASCTQGGPGRAPLPAYIPPGLRQRTNSSELRGRSLQQQSPGATVQVNPDQFPWSAISMLELVHPSYPGEVPSRLLRPNTGFKW